MNKKILCTFLCTVIFTGITFGCAKTNSDSGNENSIVSEEIPEEVKQKLTSVLEQEPVKVPDEGWTDETILDVLYVNGEHFSLPYKISNLGDGFSVFTDDENFRSGNGKTIASLYYYGKYCGGLTAYEELSPEDFLQHDFTTVSIYSDWNGESEQPEIFPISINGVTLGTDYDTLVERIGLTAEPSYIEQEKTFTVKCETENYNLKFFGTDEKVDYIAFYEKKGN